jgi:hypothetical protein
LHDEITSMRVTTKRVETIILDTLIILQLTNFRGGAAQRFALAAVGRSVDSPSKRDKSNARKMPK